MTGYVYVMKATDGTVKVGYSKNPVVRLYALDTSGTRLRLVYRTKPLPQPRRVEHLAHRLLRHAQVHGETFNASIAEAKRAIARAERIADGLEPAPPRTAKASTKVMVALKLDTDLVDELERFRQDMEIPASKTGIMEAALREFLERRRELKGAARR